MRVSLQPASIRTSASSSPRVGPRLTITTGMPRLCACRTKRRPDITVRDEPATSSAPGFGVDHRVSARHPFAGHVLAEEHDVRLEHAAAADAADDAEAVGGGQLRVAVGSGLDRGARRLDEAGVGRGEPLLERAAAAAPSACGADDVGDAAVQVDQGAAARAGVQAIDVLGDQPTQRAAALQLGERAVAVVGRRLADPGPADVAARPVAALRGSARTGTPGTSWGCGGASRGRGNRGCRSRWRARRR